MIAVNAAKAKAAYDKIQAASHATTMTVAAIFEEDTVFKDSESCEDSEEYIDANEVEEYMPCLLPFLTTVGHAVLMHLLPVHLPL